MCSGCDGPVTLRPHKPSQLAPLFLLLLLLPGAAEAVEPVISGSGAITTPQTMTEPLVVPATRSCFPVLGQQLHAKALTVWSETGMWRWQMTPSVRVMTRIESREP